MKRENKERRRSEFARCYGSKARVAWVKRQPCVWCGVGGENENAHTVNGGKSRKGDYTTIVPLCRTHHCAFDEHRDPFDSQFVRDFATVVMTDFTESRWQEYLAAQSTPGSTGNE